MKKASTLRPVPAELPRSSHPITFEPFNEQAQVVLDRFGLSDPEFCQRITEAQHLLEGSEEWRPQLESILVGLFQRSVPRDQVRACLLSWWTTAHKGREWIEQELDKAEKAEKPKQTRKPPAVADDGFIRTAAGRAVPQAYNLRHALKLLETRLHFCELKGKYRAEIEGKNEIPLDDDAIQDLRLSMEERFGIQFGKQYFTDTLLAIAREDRRHPVREYLSGLGNLWDNRPRIRRWLTTYLGVQESEYSNEVGLRVLIAAVARVMQPGCKFDQMLVLEGKQGAGKSKALAALMPNAEWFSDSVRFTDDNRAFIESTAGRWIVEASELGGLGRRDVETLKAILSRQTDVARLAYAQNTIERPRQCVLIATTNESVYLRDPTGNRRFWPVRVEQIDLQKLEEDRDQLWAEACHRFKAGEPWTMRQELWLGAAIEQGARAAADPVQEAIEDRLSEFTDARIAIDDLWTLLGMQRGTGKQMDSKRIAEAMGRLGWQRGKHRFPNRLGTIWCYQIGNGEQKLTVTRPKGSEAEVIRQADENLFGGTGPEVSK